MHIINLATQAVISACTKSKYYNGGPSDDHIPEDIGDNERNEIGIIQAICIKVRNGSYLFAFGTTLVGLVGMFIIAAEGSIQEHPASP